MYGRTGSGKTTQIGTLAEDVFKRTQKRTRLYSTDRGGYDTIQPYIDLGIIEVEELGAGDVWIFMNKAVTGAVKGPDGKWLIDEARNKDIGFYAFESGHSMARLIQQDMEMKAGFGIVLGGDTNTSFDIKGDGETIKIGSTKGFQKYAIPQARVQEAMLKSHKLPAEYILWTAGVSKDDDDVNSTKIVGPGIIGQALTGTLPQEFNYTFRIDTLPAENGKNEEHVMYLGTNKDVNAGGAAALGNIRRPLDAKPLTSTAVKPANIITALNIVRNDATKDAVSVIKQRLGLK